MAVESGSVETVGRFVVEAAARAVRGGAIEQVGPRGGAVEVHPVSLKDGRRVARKP